MYSIARAGGCYILDVSGAERRERTGEWMSRHELVCTEEEVGTTRADVNA